VEELIGLIKAQYCPRATDDEILAGIVELNPPDPDAMTIKEMKAVGIAINRLLDIKEEAIAIPVLRQKVKELESQNALLQGMIESLNHKYDSVMERLGAVELEVEVLSATPQIQVEDLEPEDDNLFGWFGGASTPEPAKELTGREVYEISMEHWGIQNPPPYPGDGMPWSG
jgi:hypothetical protein